MHSRPKTLFDFPFSGNGYKVRLALTQLGLPFEYRVVDLLAGDAQQPEFLAVTPMGQVPALLLEHGAALVVTVRDDRCSEQTVLQEPPQRQFARLGVPTCKSSSVWRGLVDREPRTGRPTTS